MFDLTGRHALVTGATGGIGGAIARALHGQGAAVAVSGTRTEVLDALVADLFSVASEMLRPHGRLVLINPLRATPAADASMQLEARRTVDLGLRHRTGVEVWRKV